MRGVGTRSMHLFFLAVLWKFAAVMPDVLASGPAGEDSYGGSASTHWSFQPVERPSLPTARRTDWVQSPIDIFIQARLEELQLEPSMEADRGTLLRRLSLDLRGLPPSADELQEFLEDERPDAYQRLVDRLLASPHFGERWGMHWLDLARYGDSDGYEQDEPRPFAYRWRDWVLAALNADMPFDQFTVEQLAGDLLPEPEPSQLLATGFHRNAPTNREGGIDREEARRETIVDRVNTTGTVWLGLTVGCAECHTHKFDPLTIAEYYQLYAFFNDAVDEVDAPVAATPEETTRYQRELRSFEEQLALLRQQLEQATDGVERERLMRSLERFERRRPAELKTVMAVFGPADEPRQTHVHQSGNYRKPGIGVGPQVPDILPPLKGRRGQQPPDRLDLARWLVSPENPLTARVEVNRIWQYLFGEGLVRTPDDFGTQGERPTHPELLDYLASEFVASGWSRKTLIRRIVCSATYRQASAHRADLAARDPDNRWLARQNRFRLDAEVVRDLAFASAGLLDGRIGGPGFRPPVPESFQSFTFRFGWNEDAPAELRRRGMYIFFQRNMVFPMLRTFDRSDTNLVCVRRERSNTPLQALTLLNDPQFLDAYRALARELLYDPQRSPKERVARLYLAALSRKPSARERSALIELAETLSQYYQATPEAAAAIAGSDAPDTPAHVLAAWTAVVRVILNTDEFVTRE